MTGPATAVLAALIAGGSLAALSIADRSGNAIGGHAYAIDGDTLDVEGARVRLAAIDAPEAQQTCNDANGQPWACGAHATIALRRMLSEVGWSVSCQVEARDRYGRSVATCRTPDHRDLGARMVATGMAVKYDRYGGERYQDEEAAAKAERLGLWAGKFEMPWDWRREHRR